MNKRIFILAHDQARANAARYIANEAPEGFRVTVSEPKRKDLQNDKFHAMLSDIAKQCFYSGRKLQAESWKRLLVEAFVFILREEAKGQGKPDPFPTGGALLPSLDGLRIVQVEVLTRNFTVNQAAQLIEYLYAYGAENNICWSEPKEMEAV